MTMKTDLLSTMTPQGAVNHIRAELGCGLREAYDFYLRGRETWPERMAKLKAESGPQGYESNEEKIRQAVRRYYLALDKREHGQIAQDKALTEIQDILNMQWVQGAELAKQPKENT